MPELPEMETIRRGLVIQLVGRQITAIGVLQTQLRYPVDSKSLQKQAIGYVIEGTDRHAKYLLFRLRPGRLWVGPLQDALHDHLIFQLGADVELRFHDTRRFGMCFMTTAEIITAAHYAAHIQRFSDGQFAVVDTTTGRVVACSTNFRTNAVDFKHIEHRYIDVVDHNWLGYHDPQGVWLYGADIGVLPAYRTMCRSAYHDKRLLFASE